MDTIFNKQSRDSQVGSQMYDVSIKSNRGFNLGKVCSISFAVVPLSIVSIIITTVLSYNPLVYGYASVILVVSIVLFVLSIITLLGFLDCLATKCGGYLSQGLLTAIAVFGVFECVLTMRTLKNTFTWILLLIYLAKASIYACYPISD